MLAGGRHAAFSCSDGRCAQNAGFATWNIEYRRLGQAGGGWPGTYLDVGTAVDLLRTLAPQHQLDLNHVIVMGHSAGGAAI